MAGWSGMVDGPARVFVGCNTNCAGCEGLGGREFDGLPSTSIASDGRGRGGGGGGR